jgi:hypothetical protein
MTHYFDQPNERKSSREEGGLIPGYGGPEYQEGLFVLFLAGIFGCGVWLGRKEVEFLGKESSRKREHIGPTSSRKDAA